MHSMLLVLTLACVGSTSIDDYTVRRAKITRAEARIAVGGTVDLNRKEAELNACLMGHKYSEVDYGFHNPQYYNFSRHFFHYKNDIHNSKVYKIIRDMPKGAALHIHDMAILGPDYILSITYLDQLYVCCIETDPTFKFSIEMPQDPCACVWQLMSEARQTAASIEDFDVSIRNRFTMYTDDPHELYPTIKETWDAFGKYFIRIKPLVTYRPVWEQYLYEALQQFREDNIIYLEVRTSLHNLYELNGTVHDMLFTARTYKRTIDRFLKNNPDFFGAKLIFAPWRRVNNTKLNEYLNLARVIKADMPDEFAGFSLVGQEDAGRPLIDFVPELLNSSSYLNYFFHAGGTDWSGTSTDSNLYDAILLGTKRLGHAYALPKHPLLMKEVIDRDIGIEVNVISNAVLSLTHDIRNHPLSVFLARGMPVVLSSDAPGVWEANSSSDDFYVAFVAISNHSADLRLLKQLGMNSLRYSAIDAVAQFEAMTKFDDQWNKFVDNFDCSRY